MTPTLRQSARSRLDRFAAFVAQYVPDAITASVILLVVFVIASLAFGNPPAKVLDAYLPRPVDAAPVHHADDAAHPPELRAHTYALLSSCCIPSIDSSWDHLPGGSRRPRQLRLRLSVLGARRRAQPDNCCLLCPTRQAPPHSDRLSLLLAAITAGNAVWQFGLSASAPCSLPLRATFWRLRSASFP